MRSEPLGGRVQIATLKEKLADATGNRDGVVGNENLPANVLGAHPVSGNPILFGLGRFFSVGWSKKDEQARLTNYLQAAEQRWGSPVTNLQRPDHLSPREWNVFRTDKAILLARFDRKPDQVEELIVHARGTVNGDTIAPRNLFVQRYKPQGKATGKTVVVAPGFLETGRNYAEQAMFMSAKGYEVLVLDQQWAGLSEGKRGRIDRGFGIARDVAAVAAQAAADAKSRTGNAKVVIVGTSMGGGAGAYGAAHLNDAGLIQLDGHAMPKGVDLVLQDPFFARTGGLINSSLAAVGRVPLLKEMALPAIGLPILSSDPVTLRKIAAHAKLENIAGRPQAFNASTGDLAFIKRQLERGVRPSGGVYVIHARNDTLAAYDETVSWVSLLGPQARLRTLESDSHVIEENPAEQLEVVEGLRWLDERTPL